jgi:hypothetical protein
MCFPWLTAYARSSPNRVRTIRYADLTSIMINAMLQATDIAHLTNSLGNDQKSKWRDSNQSGKSRRPLSDVRSSACHHHRGMTLSVRPKLNRVTRVIGLDRSRDLDPP